MEAGRFRARVVRGPAKLGQIKEMHCVQGEDSSVCFCRYRCISNSSSESQYIFREDNTHRNTDDNRLLNVNSLIKAMEKDLLNRMLTNVEYSQPLLVPQQSKYITPSHTQTLPLWSV